MKPQAYNHNRRATIGEWVLCCIVIPLCILALLLASELR